MHLFSYLIIAIISGTLNIYPLSLDTHIYIYQNLFNTTIFNNQNILQFLNISPLITIILININDIPKTIISIIKNNKKIIKIIFHIIITSSLNTIIYLVIKPRFNTIKNISYYFFITAIILFFIKGKNGKKKYYEITTLQSIVIGLSSILIIIPTNNILLCNLLTCSFLKLEKKTSLKYSLTCLIPIYIINTLKGIIWISSNQNYLLPSCIAITLSIFISYETYKSLKYLYFNNKLYRLSLYSILFAIFIFYWFF